MRQQCKNCVDCALSGTIGSFYNLDIETSRVGVKMGWGKPKKLKPFKQEYAKVVNSAIPFGGKKWKFFNCTEGCMPLLTAQTVSLDGVEWGEVQPRKTPPPPEVDWAKIPPGEMTYEQFKQLSAEVAAYDRAEQAAKAKTQKEAEDIANGVRPEGVEVEEGELETFDLQDIKLGTYILNF